MHTFFGLKGGDGIGGPHLISVVKSEKYALRGVLDFFSSTLRKTTIAGRKSEIERV